MSTYASPFPLIFVCPFPPLPSPPLLAASFHCMRDEMSPSNFHDEDTKMCNVAIIGASYAGLTLGNVLHRHSAIPYTIFDCKSLPFTYVMGGTKFNVPLYSTVAQKMELEGFFTNPTRQDVSVSLLARVKENLIAGQTMVKIEKNKSDFYLHTQNQSTNSTNKNDCTIHGPFQIVVGADGVLSKCRKAALPGSFLIGDARWVNDRWYDLGIRRINQGANIAMSDGLELGDVMAKCITSSPCAQSIQTRIQSETKGRFCARDIYLQKTKRQLTFMLLLVSLICGRSAILSKFQLLIHATKDLVFQDGCLSHDHDNPLVSFEFRELLQRWMGSEGTYFILQRQTVFWIQSSMLIIAQSFVAVVLASVIYKFIIQRRGPNSSYLLSWGDILPLAVVHFT